MVGELVLVRNRLVRLGLNSGDEAMAKAVANLDVVTGDLQMSVMKTRMQPIKKVFGRFPRLVRDLARNMKKEINLELVGEETDLDKNLVEALADPLVHLVRNAVDHGIESPEEREAAGKPRVGQVVLSAEQEGDHILLMITDDGKGMDAEVLRNKAVEKGLLERDAADRLTDLECYNLIFAPGFSTKTEISDVSGRGVGMDVVKTKISQLNGTVNVFSQKGSGSKIVIKVPLTLAIMPTLMVMLGSQAFAFPLVNVNEIFHLDLSRTNVVDGQEVVIVRDKALPLFYLKRWLVPSAAHEEQGEGHVVILSVGTQRIGFCRRPVGGTRRSGDQATRQDVAGHPRHGGRHHHRGRAHRPDPRCRACSAVTHGASDAAYGFPAAQERRPLRSKLWQSKSWWWTIRVLPPPCLGDSLRRWTDPGGRHRHHRPRGHRAGAGPETRCDHHGLRDAADGRHHRGTQHHAALPDPGPDVLLADPRGRAGDPGCTGRWSGRLPAEEFRRTSRATRTRSASCSARRS